MNRRLLLIGILVLAGCRGPERRPLFETQPVPPPSPRPVLPASPAPAPPPAALVQPAPPPGAFPTAPPAPPPSTLVLPPPPGMSAPGAAAPPASPVAPPPGPTGAAAPPSEAVAQIEHRWQPAENAPRVQLGAPEPVAGADPKSPARMYPPNVTAEPPLRDSAGTGLPVGIRQFATAMDNVAVGLQPSGEGLEWLKAHGYRAVLHIHLPGEDETTDRKTAEQHGLKYSSLEVSPQALTKATAQEFNRSVGDTSNHPLFVYDADGALAGGLWYLHFRLNQQFSDDVARLRASALGLREQSTGLHGDMWLAIQKYLSEGDR